MPLRVASGAPPSGDASNENCWMARWTIGRVRDVVAGRVGDEQTGRNEINGNRFAGRHGRRVEDCLDGAHVLSPGPAGRVRLWCEPETYALVVARPSVR